MLLGSFDIFCYLVVHRINGADYFGGAGIITLVATTTIPARGVIRSMSGQCEPLLIDCHGDTQYVVKCTGNPERERVLIAEWICYHLAGDLGVPVPKFNLIDISPELAAVMQLSYPWVTPGLHFGSEFLARSYANPPPGLSARSVRVQHIPGIIALDYLVYNRDRAYNERNLLYSKTADGWDVVAIDFSHAFYAPIWDETMLAQRKCEFDPDLLEGKVYKRLLPLINGNSPFWHFFKALSELSTDRIRHIIDSVPPEWGLTREDNELLFDFLCVRKDALVVEMHLLQRLMPWWKGGVH